MIDRPAVILSQGPTRNPARRTLEQQIVAGLLASSGLQVTIVPPLYDLDPDGLVIRTLKQIPRDLVVLSWLYDRATHWVLNAHGIRGQVGDSLLKPVDAEDVEQESGEAAGDSEPGETSGPAGRCECAGRRIYSLDLRWHDQAAPFVTEVTRIARRSSAPLGGGSDCTADAPGSAVTPGRAQPNSDVGNRDADVETGDGANGPASPRQDERAHAARSPGRSIRIAEGPAARWYPVIDYSRCTNCMECVDFCLFGVYGLDETDTILVEQPDNCRKGCPACSRVCPENAVLFPRHKTPAIAGGTGQAGRKIDLSQLFGASSAAESAARERDEQLRRAGREARDSASAGMPSSPPSQPPAPKDELDKLVDQLGELEL